MIKWGFPVIFMSLLLLVPLFYRKFRQSTSIKKVFPKDHRLYEPPMDLPPMVLAEAVYSTSLEEVNPLNKSGFAVALASALAARLTTPICREIHLPR